ncbi:unnamed protein product [Litomosoides sigmodontis]|uniref:Uncharacterized protein n=1 Tax=Litomosoides sigmodontis TaxID=42156 RepID=A0A3P6UH85_LITSI|nr:unnamed protein product [Litomosoides sigmodontis]
MDKRSDKKKQKRTNVPLVQPVVPANLIGIQAPTMNWLMNHGYAAIISSAPQPPSYRPAILRPLAVRSPVVGFQPLRTLEPRPLGPLFPIANPNMDMFFGGIYHFPLYGYMPPFIDARHPRRRRQDRTRPKYTLNLSGVIDTSSLLSTVNNAQSAKKIVTITYLDPTGGSMIVTRRREDGELDVRTVYSREFIVARSASPLALLPPPNFREMVLDMMEIIAKFPKSYYNTISRKS